MCNNNIRKLASLIDLKKWFKIQSKNRRTSDNSNTHMHNHSLAGHGTGISIKSGEIKKSLNTHTPRNIIIINV